jgi:hypothetical protein
VTHNGVRHDEPQERKLLAERALNHGFGNALGTATELALLPALFGLLGWWLDGLLGTEPFLLIAFLIFSFAGMLVRAWIGYDRDMREQEAGLYTRLARRNPPGGAA